MLAYPSIIERMKRIRQFRGLSTSDLKTILGAGKMKRCPAGSTIYLEGAPSFGLCVLLKGDVHLYKMGPEGKENIIAEIKAVIMFNEVAAIDGQPNPVTAVAFHDSLIWYADHETFQLGLKRFPQLGIGLLPILARRNRKLIAKYADLSFRSVRERVAKMLLELSNHGEHPINRDEHSTQQMAAQIVTVPVVISRALGELRDEGLIDCTRNLILVQQPEKLAHEGLLEYDSFPPE